VSAILTKPRRVWVAQGLTQRGTPRKYKLHPELRGGPRATYDRRYNQLLRPAQWQKGAKS